jgi:hypothetical protein
VLFNPQPRRTTPISPVGPPLDENQVKRDFAARPPSVKPKKVGTHPRSASADARPDSAGWLNRMIALWPRGRRDER